MSTVNLSLARRVIMGLEILTAYTQDEEHIVSAVSQIWAGPELAADKFEYDENGNVLPQPVFLNTDINLLEECGWEICEESQRWTIFL